MMWQVQATVWCFFFLFQQLFIEDFYRSIQRTTSHFTIVRAGRYVGYCLTGKQTFLVCASASHLNSVALREECETEGIVKKDGDEYDCL